jgi:Zn-dependent protease with chaperone function
VAELLDGRPIDPNTTDPDERRVLNVVEEMAIASGTPVPPVYLLENEEGINAFAAGYTPSDAVIGVTRGCVQTLTRDELQGVIAHEFSHILNGDMRLNIRLMGVLYGILMISITGWLIFRFTAGGSSRRSNGDKKEGNNPLPLLGLALYVIGFVGVFFARLIKAAVSRQREYLADASAVQFTRNPPGIAGALKKIGASADGSRVRDAEAEEVSHMFFGEALGLSGLMATHPPLADRIHRIDPTFDGDFSAVELAPARSERLEASASPRHGTGRAPHPRSMRFDPVRAITSIGTLGPENLAYASTLLASLPDPVTDAARDPSGACALVYALLLDQEDESVRDAQLAHLAGHEPAATADETRKLSAKVRQLGAEARLPVLELALPALHLLSPAQYEAFTANVDHLVEADRRIDLFEYALRRMLLRHLAPQFGKFAPPKVVHVTVPPLVQPTAILLSALARADRSENSDPPRSFRSGIEALQWPLAHVEILPPESSGLKAVDGALKVLEAAAPRLKKRVLEACAACIGANGLVTTEEGELLRAVADALDCPMPPLMAEAGTALPRPIRETSP